jgi:hypothetical protein
VSPRELCELMVEFGLVRIRHGDTELERPAHLAMASAATEPDKAEEPEEDPLDEILRMTPEQQDRALQLAPTARR